MKIKATELFKQQCYINGQWRSAHSGATFPVHNPSNGAHIGDVPKMGVKETKEAIEAATKALPAWKAKTGKERGVILRRWYDLIMQHVDDLAAIMTTEQGKPLVESAGEVRYGASFIEWYAEEAKRIYGDIIPPVMKDQRLLVIKQPVGVVAAITPWNFPHAMITRKCGPALAVGCTIVLKPAEATPFSALALAELATQAGIPPGVINIITGNPTEIGPEMTSNPHVRKLTFTGSTKVGKLLMSQCSTTVKKVTLELGGSAPFIIFADADIESAVQGLMQSKFRNSGQTCVCADRIFVEDKIYDAFTHALIQAVKAMKVGDGFEKGVQLGPLINQAAIDKVDSHVKDALSKGATLACGGKLHPAGKLFYEPTVITHVNNSMQIMREETFGPVAPIMRFKTEEEAVELANDTQYGLASYFYGRDIDRLWRVAEHLDYGMVSINGGLFTNEVTPFGGIKESGNGREGSMYGVNDYLEIKYICITSKPHHPK